MIITKNWLNEWINVSNISTKRICKILNAIGLEVDSVTKHRVPKKVVVGYVLECEKHSDADKLSVCQVDVGNGETKQIVCGAKNVQKGQFVPVALPGCILGKNFKIEESTLRGVKSYGMICSSKEIGLPEMNDGILVLDKSIGELEIGKELSEYEQLNDDVIDIELTANRGDCLSVYGVARDLSVPLKAKMKTIVEYEEDHNGLGVGRVLNLSSSGKADSSLTYKVFSQKSIKSPLLVDLRLAFADELEGGDLCRLVYYSSYATGVLLRVYGDSVFKTKDSDMSYLVVKKDENGLDSLNSDKVISQVGVFQETDSKPQKNDENIILEASYIDPETISMQSSGLSIKSDKYYYRATRGSEPELSFGVNHFQVLTKKYCDITWYSGIQQIEQNYADLVLNVDLEKINSLIGQKVEKSEFVKILKGLGFGITIKDETGIIAVSVPQFRHDVKNEQDISEEIVRIVGIDNIKSESMKFTEKNRINESFINFKKRIYFRKRAVGVGFFETISYLFDDKKRIEKFSLPTLVKRKELANPITSEMSTLRSTLLLNLLESVEKNSKFGKKSIRLFEIGKVFDKQRSEISKISFIFGGEVEKESIQNHGKPNTIDFFTFAQKVSSVIGDFDIEQARNKNMLVSPYEYGFVVVNGERIGFIGRVHINIEKELDLPRSYICEIDFDKISHDKKIAQEFSKFPATSRDLSLMVSKKMKYEDIRQTIKGISLPELSAFYPIDKYESKNLKDKISLTLKFVLQSSEKTLNDEEINAIMDKILNELKEKKGIGIR